MKLHVVYDKNGDIVAAARLDSTAPVHARPNADEKAGHRAAEVSVPTEYQKDDLAGIFQKLRVDVKSKSPELKPKG
jgi:hypothetical protein